MNWSRWQSIQPYYRVESAVHPFRDAQNHGMVCSSLAFEVQSCRSAGVANRVLPMTETIAIWPELLYGRTTCDQPHLVDQIAMSGPPSCTVAVGTVSGYAMLLWAGDGEEIRQ